MRTKTIAAAAAVFVAFALCQLASPDARAAGAPANLFANPSFEDGREGWQFDKTQGTSAFFAVDEQDAADGRVSALVTIESATDWGLQFGQSMDAGAVGKTYTFAAVAKAVRDPVAVRLEIERRADPYDRAAATDKVTLKPGAWTELHVTFKVEKEYPQGWFAYLSCQQAGAPFRVDAYRLYEGEYVPYQKAAKAAAAAPGAAVAGIKAPASAVLYDTGSRAAAPLTGEAVAARTGWTAVPADAAAPTFKGDAVIDNGRLAVILRHGARGAEVYASGAKGFTLRATLSPVADAAQATSGGDVKLEGWTVAANAPGAVAVDADFKAPGGKVRLRYELAMGQAFVKTDSLKSAAALRVDAPCRFLVMPDFFADDIVIDAAEIPVATADLPSESFLLHLVGDGDAILMTVSKDRDEDIRVSVDGQGDRRAFQGSVIRYGKDGRVWVAALEAPGIWHRRNIVKADTGKVARLDWTAPFPAQWRMDWRKSDRLVDSWEVIAQKPGGDFEKPGLFGDPITIPADRSRWTTVLGSFKYPCWIDRQGQASIEPLRSDAVRFEGPAFLYPINRTRATPLGALTVGDIARATLGVGPCEYILDVEGQGSAYKGRATLRDLRDALREIYGAKQQKARRAEVEKILDEVQVFVRHIRGRINTYVDFGHKTIVYLDEQKKADPSLARFADQLEPLLRKIDGYVENRRADIKTPEDAAAMIQKFRATCVGYEGPDAFEKCKAFTEAMVGIGGSQDELAGECRMATKIVRQRAAPAMATDPHASKVAEEIRRRTQEVLRSPAAHEGARH